MRNAGVEERDSFRDKFARIGPTIWGRGIIEDTTREQHFIGVKI